MARKNQYKVDPTRPFYAVVGGVDVAVAYARTGLTDVQTRVAKVDFEPKALAETGRTVVVSRVDELQKEAKALPKRVEAKLDEYVAEIGGTVEDLNKQYADLAARGRDLVGRIRRQQATQDLKAASKNTVTKAKTTTTQTKKAADTAGTEAKKAAGETKKSARTATTRAKKAAGPATSSAKATGTTAKKTATAATKATVAAAEKTGN